MAIYSGLTKIEGKWEMEMGNTDLTVTLPASFGQDFEEWIEFDPEKETIDDWVTQVKPSQIDSIQDGIGWISVHNPLTVQEKSEFDKEAYVQFYEMMQSLKTAGKQDVREEENVKERCISGIINIAKKQKYTSGKWMLSPTSRHVDNDWAKVAKATYHGELGFSAKVSPKNSHKSHLICVYTTDFTDESLVKRLLDAIIAIGLKPWGFKPDVFTVIGIYNDNEWGLPQTLYNEMLSGINKTRNTNWRKQRQTNTREKSIQGASNWRIQGQESLQKKCIEGIIELDCKEIKNLKMSSINRQLIILSWNIDGLDEREIRTRALSVVTSIQTHKADVVTLQEVVDENLQVFEEQLGSTYMITIHKRHEYYNVIMVKRDVCFTSERKYIEFQNSNMGRFLLVHQFSLNETPFVILTTHLESLRDGSRRRKEQLNICFNVMKEYLPHSNVIFAGDMNLREHELKSLGGLPIGVHDAWISCGSHLHHEYTWDLERNDNKKFEQLRLQPRERYDRMYYASLRNKGIKCTMFELVGTRKIQGCGLYPSDHFGMLAKFKFD